MYHVPGHNTQEMTGWGTGKSREIPEDQVRLPNLGKVMLFSVAFCLVALRAQ